MKSRRYPQNVFRAILVLALPDYLSTTNLAMDPLSIAASVGGLTCACLTIAKKLCDITGKYKGVSRLVNSIHSEAKIIGFSLSQLQGLLLDNSDEAILKTEVREELDIVLTGCAVVFSCLKDEITALVERMESETGQLNVGDKVSVVWKEDNLKELLDRLRGQHTALGVLLQCLQTYVHFLSLSWKRDDKSTDRLHAVNLCTKCIVY